MNKVSEVILGNSVVEHQGKENKQPNSNKKMEEIRNPEEKKNDTLLSVNILIF